MVCGWWSRPVLFFHLGKEVELGYFAVKSYVLPETVFSS